MSGVDADHVQHPHPHVRREDMKRTTRIATTTALALGLLAPVAGMTGSATPAAAADGDANCQVTGGTLTWGVKEAFRSYISGAIANGEWTVSDGASYETPEFSFGEPSGEIDANTGEGSVSFVGTVNFTGHDGVLNLTLANPTIEFVGDGSARLRLDTTSNNAEGKVAIDETQASVGKLNSIGELDPASGSVTVSGAPAILTADGAAAFSGYYSTGEDLDPISLQLELGSCVSDGSAAANDDETHVIAPAPEAENDVPWLPIIIGGVAVVIIVVAGVLLVVGRKNKPEA